MKKLIVIILMAILAIQAKATAQNQQIKVYLQQIAANKAYIELLQKGYQIVKKGWKTIGDIKQVHFTMDGDFFKSLEAINPKVKNYAKVAASIVLLNSTKKQIQNLSNAVNTNNLFSASEKDYVSNVGTNVQSECVTQFDILQTIITDSQLKMSDDERIKRIEAVYDAAADVYSFVNAFVSDVQILVLQKTKEQKEVNNYRKAADLK
ncbi:hypothetical protein [Pinibacter aurantiacus]|uniref:TerB family tellurite resistance protein n=1 Tax=Pinibacter aurantiacus TaxID=2851599 RepID=A0A9E2SED8_9BACT|nr:hypothetical protein [Pinibacter aurantiacus]MBV4359075.1 hypothetical protein [Pinibacter aurantiacus]